MNSFQVEILKEAIVKKNGGMCLPMGTGKTLLSIVLALKQSVEAGERNPILIVVSKTLIESWVNEIRKFFKESLKFTIFHTDYSTELGDLTGINAVITTPETITKHYKLEDIQRFLVVRGSIINYFPPHVEPFLEDSQSGLFSIKWAVLLVDEMQTFTNIQSTRCEAMISICATNVWGLSGTMFAEPNAKRLLGYFLMIRAENFPNNLPEATAMIRNRDFQGIAHSIVFRESNEAFVAPKVNSVIVENTLSAEEQKIYLSMKDALDQVSKMAKQYKRLENHIMSRKFSAYLLSMLTILRQTVVCPLLPISGIAVDLADTGSDSDLSVILQRHLDSLNITEWLNDINSAKSSRIKKVIECVDSPENTNKKLVLFTSFRSSLDLVIHFIQHRKVFTLTADMSPVQRQSAIDEFKSSSNGILALTYQIGAEGLNLQFCDTVLLVDFWWNSGKTDQAIARVLRYGQLSSQVNVYYFTSNTGIESAIFGKHHDKKEILKQLQHGPTSKKIKQLKIADLIKLINMQDNVLSMKNLSI